MCFSPEASFIAGSALLVVGTYTTITAIRSGEKEYIPFAAIPLLFWLHQIAEGFLWIVLPNQDLLQYQTIFKFVFLAFSQVVRPIWIPLSCTLIEKDSIHKKILTVSTYIGAGVAMYLLYCLVAFQSDANIIDQHIKYTLDFPHQLKLPISILYLLAIVGAPLISSRRSVQVLGVLLLVTLIGTFVWSRYHLISVRCFFAALLSIGICIIIRNIGAPKMHRTTQ